ncbi:MAG: DUF882 domain-containing protein [Polyangia bacterium]
MRARSTLSHRAAQPTSDPEPTPGAPHRASTKKHAKKVVVVPPAELVSINTHEAFELRPTSTGDFSKQTMRALAHFLRCHHTQKVHAMSERLARLLYTTAKHFDFAKLEVVAGYRAPRIAREKGNPKSPHKKGLACDFRIPGITNEALRDYARTLPRTGVGYYPNSGFVHLDSREKQSAFWIDYSHPGERAQYTRPDIAPDVVPGGAVGDAPEGSGPQGDEDPGVIAPNLPALEPARPRKDD